MFLRNEEEQQIGACRGSPSYWSKPLCRRQADDRRGDRRQTVGQDRRSRSAAFSGRHPDDEPEAAARRCSALAVALSDMRGSAVPPPAPGIIACPALRKRCRDLFRRKLDDTLFLRLGRAGDHSRTRVEPRQNVMAMPDREARTRAGARLRKACSKTGSIKGGNLCSGLY